MFRMKWTGSLMLLLLVIYGLLLSEIPLVHGLKCYECQANPTCNQKEVECEAGFDRCFTEDVKDGNSIRLSKSCSTKVAEKTSPHKCGDYGSAGIQWCFCSTDLCNEAPMSMGFWKRQLPFNFIVSLSSYVVMVHLFL